MVGFFTAVTKLLDPDAVGKAVADSVPATFRELNLKAFERGFAYGLESLAEGRHSQELEHVTLSED
jgi:2-oxoglutarate ferredoxin oxidoreductase subunit gamma